MSNPSGPKKPSAKPRTMSARLSLSDFIKKHLERNRMRVSALCRKSGVLPSVFSKVLSGRQNYVSTETVLKLAKAMKVEESVLYRAMRNSKSANVDKSEIETCVDRSKSLHHNI